MKKPSYSLKRKIIWKKVKNVKGSCVLLIATAFGAGLVPWAPGTMGTLVAIPLAYGIQQTDWGIQVLFWIILISLGTWSAKEFDEMMATQDNQNIVIDEVIGLGISAWTAGNHWENWVAAFFLFRLFDVLKPPPIRMIDLYSKKRTSSRWSPWWGGLGVIADDILAGLEALGVILILQGCKWLPGRV